MELTTRSNVAKRAGVSRAAVGEAVNAGNLRLVGEGRTAKIDLHDKLTQEYILSQNAQRKPKAQEIIRADAIKTAGSPLGKREALPPEGPLPLPDLQTASDEQMRALSRNDIDRYILLEKLAAQQLKNRQDRLLLIERSTVRRAFGKLYQVDNTQLKTLPTRLSPEIASITKVDEPDIILKIEEIIEKEVFRTLTHIKSITNDLFKNIELEPIAD